MCSKTPHSTFIQNIQNQRRPRLVTRTLKTTGAYQNYILDKKIKIYFYACFVTTCFDIVYTSLYRTYLWKIAVSVQLYFPNCFPCISLFFLNWF